MGSKGTVHVIDDLAPRACRVHLVELAIRLVCAPLFLPLLAPFACAGAAPAWSAAPPLLHARAAHAAVATDDAIYVLAGTDAAGAPVRQVERFDGAGWRVETELPGPGLNAPAAVALAGQVFVLGGFETTTNIPSARAYVYAPSSRTWAETTPLPAPRGGHAAVVLTGKIHVLGGGNDRTTLPDHDVYDPTTHTWTARAPLPRAEGSPAAVAFGDTLVVIGGRSGPLDFGAVDLYDPTSDTWSAGPAITPRATVGAAVYCGSVYITGGEAQAEQVVLGDFLRLDGQTWRPLAPLPSPRSFARAVVLRGALYVVGGGRAPQTSHAPEGSAETWRFVSVRRTPS